MIFPLWHLGLGTSERNQLTLFIIFLLILKRNGLINTRRFPLLFQLVFATCIVPTNKGSMTDSEKLVQSTRADCRRALS